MADINATRSSKQRINAKLSVGSHTEKDYNKLTNKPQINSVELVGNKELVDFGIQPAGQYLEEGEALSNLEIEAIINNIML